MLVKIKRNGKVRDLKDKIANLFIKHGLAEEVKAEKKQSPKPKQTKKPVTKK